MRYFWVVACLIAWGLGGVGAAQETAPPANEDPGPAASEPARPVTPAAPLTNAPPPPVTSVTPTQPSTAPDSEVWRAVRAERDRERLELADAWMLHFDTHERSELRLQRWVTVTFFGLATIAWSAFAIDSQIDHGDVAATLALSGGAAVSVAFIVAALLTSDPYAARTVGAWGSIAELAMGGVAAGFVGGRTGCGQDCGLFLSTLVVSAFAQAFGIAMLELFAPPVIVSKHYNEYRNLAASERAPYAIDLLVAQETRQHLAQYTMFTASIVASSAYTYAAIQAETRTGRLGFAAAAGLGFSVAAVNLLVQLLQRTPSERLLAGQPPPRPDAF
jgi:hypothetical protein